jgi:hypothetical protein
MRVARESSTCCPPIPKGFTCRSTIQGSCSVVLPLELLHSVSACWLAQRGIVAGDGTIADGIKSGSLRQRGIPRLPLGGRRIAQGAGHRDPGDRIARGAIDLNAPAAGRNVLADLVVVPKFRVFGRSVLVADPRARTFGRSVLAGPAFVPKLRMFGRSVPAADPKARTFGLSVLADLVVVPKLRMFGRSVLVVLVRVPKSQAFGLNGVRLVPRLQVVQRVLVVHDPATRLAPAAGIVTSLVRVRINRHDNNPAMQLARVESIGSRLARARISRRDNNRSTQRGLGRRVPEHSPPRDKETRASAIALRVEDDLGRTENTRCETFVSGMLLEPWVAHDYITFIIVAVCAVIGAGLFRVGIHLKSESRANTRGARQSSLLVLPSDLGVRGNEVVPCVNTSCNLRRWSCRRCAADAR